MDKLARMRRVAEFWNWLPAFRAVAEEEHIGDASEKFFKSPSALSRSVSLLEDELGVDLFDREGRNIRLNDRGRQFLRVVRRAMRLVDEGIEEVGAGAGTRDWHVAATSWLDWMLERSAPKLTGGLENVRLTFGEHDGLDPYHELLEGEIDVLLTSFPATHSDLQMRHLGDLTNRLYVAPDHDLADRETVEAEELEERAFVGTAAPETGIPEDGWPRECERRLACVVEQPSMAVELAEQAGYIASLPERYVRNREGRAEELVEISADFLLLTPVFAVRRSVLVEGDLGERTIELLEMAGGRE